MFISNFLQVLTSLIVLADLADSLPLRGSGDLHAHTTVPSRPPAAHLPKRTGSIPTKTQMDTVITSRPLQKRARLDPAVYVTSLESLYSEYAESSGSSVASAFSSFVASNSPSGSMNAEVRSSFDSIKSGGGTLAATVVDAAAKDWEDSFEGLGLDDDESTSGVISTKDGTTYWSLPSYVSIWKTLNSTARESWPTSNNYVGTYFESFSTNYPPGVMVTAPGQTTYWRSDFYMAIVASLSTIDSGMAQISWMKDNIYSGGPSLTSSANSTETGAGVTAQMFDQGQQNSGSVTSNSGQSISTSSSQGADLMQSGDGSQQSSSSSAANVVAASTNGSGSVAESGSATSSQGGTPTGAAGLVNNGGLFQCPIYTGEHGVYADCYGGPVSTSGTGSDTSSSTSTSNQSGLASAQSGSA